MVAPAQPTAAPTLQLRGAVATVSVCKSDTYANVKLDVEGTRFSVRKRRRDTMTQFESVVQKTVDVRLSNAASQPNLPPPDRPPPTLALDERVPEEARTRYEASSSHYQPQQRVVATGRAQSEPVGAAKRRATEHNKPRVATVIARALERKRDGPAAETEEIRCARAEAERRVAKHEAAYLAREPGLLCGCEERWSGICASEPRLMALRRPLEESEALVTAGELVNVTAAAKDGVDGAWYLKPGNLDETLVARVRDYVDYVKPFEELIVAKNGQNGLPCVQSDRQHPRPERTHMGLCYREPGESMAKAARRLDKKHEWVGGVHATGAEAASAAGQRVRAGLNQIAPLVSYRHNVPLHMPAAFVGRHMRTIIFEIVVHAWNKVRSILDPVSQLRPPNSVVPTDYKDDEYIRFHSDTLPTREQLRMGERTEQTRGTSVVSISLGSTMNFMVKRRLSGETLTKEFIAHAMEDMSVFVWKFRADHRFVHSPRFPKGERWGGYRTALVCRWIDASRMFDLETQFNAAANAAGEERWMRKRRSSEAFVCGCGRCEM